MKRKIPAIIMFVWLAFVVLPTAGFTAVCSNPGADGPASISGIVNTYYPGSGSASAGSMTVTVGSMDGRGSSTGVAAGDLVIVMQMQDASIDYTNTASYGGSSPGSGYTSLNSSGLYEYVVVSSVAGSTFTLAAPLQNSYRTAAATGTSGQRTFQVIRVPQYSSVTLVGTVTAPPWNGSSGGVLAIDSGGNLAWGGQTVDVTGLGFRGGAGINFTGSTTAGQSSADYFTPAPTPPVPPTGTGANRANGSKGEGIAGTPRYLFTSATAGAATNGAGAITDTGLDGYPGGSFGRGAPGNAGGGGTDGNVPANDQNTGGGGGGAYSVGGMGGYGWISTTPPGSKTGGFGGYSISMMPSLLTMGGGGGAGTTNNNTGTPGAGLASSGAAGGGIVIIRARTVTGTGTVTANGTNANSTITNDASGGGGAGGAILVFASNNNGSLGSLTANARGGNGGSNTGGGSPHGPGGGGSGGFVALTTAIGVSINVPAGVNGTTATSATTTAEYGSTASAGGYQIYTLQPTDFPGAGANALCSPLLTVSKTTSKPDTVRGGTTRYTLTVTNQSGYGNATGVSLTDALPSPFSLATTDSVTLTGGATRTVTSNPAAGATNLSWSGFSIPGGGTVAITYTVNVPVGAALATYQNPGAVTYDDPTRTSAGQTATPGGSYIGGGTVPGSNYIAASSTQEDVTVFAPATISKSFLPTSIVPGGTSTLSIIISNSNTVALNNVALTDSYPAGLTNTASPSGAISGSGCFGTVTAANGGTSVALSGGFVPAGGSCTISVKVTFAVAGSYTNTIPAGAVTNSRNITNTAAATATLNQAAVQPPSVTKSFLPAQIQQGANATLSLTVANGGTTNLTGIAFSDALTNMQVATPSVVTNSCGGTLTAVAGSGSVTLTGASLNAGQNCSITVQVTSNTPSGAGGHANTVTGITSTQSGPGPNSNTANLIVAGTPTIAKAFAPATIAPGGTSALTFTIANPGAIPLTGATFSDNMGNLKIVATAPAGGTCGGAASNSLSAGTSNIVLSGLTIPASGSCTVTVQVTSAVSGSQSNIANGVSSVETPTPGPQSATAILNVYFPPQLSKSFAGMIQTGVAGSYSTLSIIVSNPNAGAGLSNVSFTDNLTNMNVYTTPATTSNCGGSVTAAAGGSVVALSGGTLAAGGSCTVTVRIGSSVPSPSGGHPNTIAGATSSETGATAGSPATAYLNVLQSPTIYKEFIPNSIDASTGVTTMVLTLTNPNSVVLTGGTFTDTFPANLTTTNVVQSYIGSGRGTCSGVIPSAQASGTYYTNRTFSGITIPANDSCTIWVDMRSATAGVYTNTTGGMTTSQTTSIGTASNAATLSVGRIGIGKTFVPSTIAVGSTSDITFTLNNQSGNNRTAVTFRDLLPSSPAQMRIASPLTTTNTCGGTLVDYNNVTGVIAANDTGFRLIGGVIADNATCTITVRVTVPSAGAYDNNSTNLAYSGGGVGPNSNVATLTALSMPAIAKSFSPAAVDVYTLSAMTFTLTNPNSVALANTNFTDTLTGFTVGSPAVIGGTCAGVSNSPPLAAGATALNLTIPNLLPGSCTITIPVSGSANGNYTNTTSGATTAPTGTAVGSPSNTASFTVNRQALQVTKTPSVSSATPGTSVSYDIGYSNPNSSTSLQNVVITDPIPLYTSYQSASCGPLPPGITSCNAIYSPPPAGSGNGMVTWTLGGNLNAGSSGTVRLTVVIQ
ncbi:MAG: DUF11 domain-containing protein [Geobacter sp.]|nr:DUF11 domain-containing protein [Geobacter sp.]